MFEVFTSRARRVVMDASRIAKQAGSSQVDPVHLLWAMARLDDESVVMAALQKLGFSGDQLRRRLAEKHSHEDMPSTEGHLPFSEASRQVLNKSLEAATGRGVSFVGVDHILQALLHNSEETAQVFSELGAGPARMEHALAALRGRTPIKAQHKQEWEPRHRADMRELLSEVDNETQGLLADLLSSKAVGYTEVVKLKVVISRLRHAGVMVPDSFLAIANAQATTDAEFYSKLDAAGF